MIWILKFLVHFFLTGFYPSDRRRYSQKSVACYYSQRTPRITVLRGRERTLYLCHWFISYFVGWKSTAFHNPAGGGWPSFPETLTCRPSLILTLILRRSRTGTVWFYTSTSNKRAARPKLYTMSLTRDLKRMYSRLTLVRISINL